MTVVNVVHSYVDGAHFFTSAELRGMCAASSSLGIAWKVAQHQANYLMRRLGGAELRLKGHPRIRVKAGSRKLP